MFTTICWQNYMCITHKNDWTQVPLGDRMIHLQFLVILSLPTILCLTWSSWASRGFYLIEEVEIEIENYCKGRLSGSLNLNLYFLRVWMKNLNSLVFCKNYYYYIFLSIFFIFFLIWYICCVCNVESFFEVVYLQYSAICVHDGNCLNSLELLVLELLVIIKVYLR